MLFVARGDNTVAGNALAEICRLYWYPIYAFVRRSGHSAHDAEDATQGFFAQLLRNENLQQVDREKGRLRSYLLGGVKKFMAQEWRKATAQKRGGTDNVLSIDIGDAEQRYQYEPVDRVTPDQLFDQRWAMTIIDTATDRLRREYAKRKKESQFEELKRFVLESPSDDDYQASAEALGMNANSIGVAVHRMRRRFRNLLHQQISSTLVNDEDVSDELTYLMSTFQR